MPARTIQRRRNTRCRRPWHSFVELWNRCPHLEAAQPKERCLPGSMQRQQQLEWRVAPPSSLDHSPCDHLLRLDILVRCYQVVFSKLKTFFPGKGSSPENHMYFSKTLLVAVWYRFARHPVLQYFYIPSELICFQAKPLSPCFPTLSVHYSASTS